MKFLIIFSMVFILGCMSAEERAYWDRLQAQYGNGYISPTDNSPSLLSRSVDDFNEEMNRMDEARYRDQLDRQQQQIRNLEDHLANPDGFHIHSSGSGSIHW